MSVLKTVAAKWYQIGLELNLESSQLHTVESDLRASPTFVDSEKHLKEMLMAVVECGRPSWKQIAQALSRVNETELSEQVMKDYGKPIRTSTHVCIKVKTGHWYNYLKKWGDIHLYEWWMKRWNVLFSWQLHLVRAYLAYVFRLDALVLLLRANEAKSWGTSIYIYIARGLAARVVVHDPLRHLSGSAFCTGII